MSTILEATNIKELGVSKSEAAKISKLYTGTKKEAGIGARTISEQTGISRRKVMRTLELVAGAEFSPGSYA
jgi:DNA-binding transcriptional regulator LsrR (DeoR family)